MNPERNTATIDEAAKRIWIHAPQPARRESRDYSDSRLCSDEYVARHGGRLYLERRVLTTFQKQWPDSRTRLRVSYNDYLSAHEILCRERIINSLDADLRKIRDCPEARLSNAAERKICDLGDLAAYPGVSVSSDRYTPVITCSYP